MMVKPFVYSPFPQILNNYLVLLLVLFMVFGKKTPTITIVVWGFESIYRFKWLNLNYKKLLYQ